MASSDWVDPITAVLALFICIVALGPCTAIHEALTRKDVYPLYHPNHGLSRWDEYELFFDDIIEEACNRPRLAVAACIFLYAAGLMAPRIAWRSTMAFLARLRGALQRAVVEWCQFGFSALFGAWRKILGGDESSPSIGQLKEPLNHSEEKRSDDGDEEVEPVLDVATGQGETAVIEPSRPLSRGLGNGDACVASALQVPPPKKHLSRSALWQFHDALITRNRKAPLKNVKISTKKAPNPNVTTAREISRSRDERNVAAQSTTTNNATDGHFTDAVTASDADALELPAQDANEHVRILAMDPVGEYMKTNDEPMVADEEPMEEPVKEGNSEEEANLAERPTSPRLPPEDSHVIPDLEFASEYTRWPWASRSSNDGFAEESSELYENKHEEEQFPAELCGLQTTNSEAILGGNGFHSTDTNVDDVSFASDFTDIDTEPLTRAIHSLVLAKDDIREDQSHSEELTMPKKDVEMYEQEFDDLLIQNHYAFDVDIDCVDATASVPSTIEGPIIQPIGTWPTLAASMPIATAHYTTALQSDTFAEHTNSELADDSQAKRILGLDLEVMDDFMDIPGWDEDETTEDEQSIGMDVDANVVDGPGMQQGSGKPRLDNTNTYNEMFWDDNLHQTTDATLPLGKDMDFDEQNAVREPSVSLSRENFTVDRGAKRAAEEQTTDQVAPFDRDDHVSSSKKPKLKAVSDAEIAAIIAYKNQKKAGKRMSSDEAKETEDGDGGAANDSPEHFAKKKPKLAAVEAELEHQSEVVLLSTSTTCTDDFSEQELATQKQSGEWMLSYGDDSLKDKVPLEGEIENNGGIPVTDENVQDIPCSEKDTVGNDLNNVKCEDKINDDDFAPDMDEFGGSLTFSTAFGYNDLARDPMYQDYFAGIPGYEDPDDFYV